MVQLYFYLFGLFLHAKMRNTVAEIKRRWLHFIPYPYDITRHSNLLDDAVADIIVLLNLIDKDRKRTKKK